MTDPPDHPPLRSYGRLKSRPIKPRQAALMETLLPRLRCPQAPFDPRALQPDAAETWLEIGFGGGEHMAAQAARRPDVLILGAEPFHNGVASALRHIDEQGLANVRIEHGDARALMARLPDASLVAVNSMTELFRMTDVDALVLPGMAIPAPVLGTDNITIDGVDEPVRPMMLRLTQPFNLSGHPAIVLPCGRTSDGLPLSLQLVGHQAATAALLDVAAAVEAVLDGRA